MSLRIRTIVILLTIVSILVSAPSPTATSRAAEPADPVRPFRSGTLTLARCLREKALEVAQRPVSRLLGSTVFRSARRGEIPAWRMSDSHHTPRFRPEDFFSDDYLDALERKAGRVRVEIQGPSNELGGVTLPVVGRLNIHIHAGPKKIASGLFFELPERPGTLFLDSLEIEDPLVSSGGKNALARFRELREGYARIARSGGYQALGSLSQTSFPVASLYRRFAGFSPAGPEARETFAFLDDLYRFVAKALPKEEAPKNLDDFSRFVGTVSRERRFDPSELRAWEEYVRFRKLAPNVQEFMGPGGEVLGLRFSRGTEARPVFALFDPRNPRRILEWSDLAAERRLELVAPLAAGGD